MKNLMLIAAFLIPTFCFAQINGNSKFFVGAELAGNSSDQILDLRMTPRFGYFVSDKFVLGIASDREILNVGLIRLRDLSVFARYYVPVNMEKYSDFWQRFTFFGEVSMKGGFGINLDSENLKISNNLNIDSHVGANIKLNDKLFLEAALTPDILSWRSVDLSPRIGIEYRFGTKKESKK